MRVGYLLLYTELEMKRGIYYFTLPPEDGKETIYPNGCKHFFYIQAKNVCTLICQSYSALTILYVPHDLFY